MDDIERRDRIEDAVPLPEAEHSSNAGFKNGLLLGLLLGAAIATAGYIALSLWFR